MGRQNNALTSLYIYCILRLDASMEKPFSAPMVHRRLAELGIELDRKTVLNHVRTLTDELPFAGDEQDNFFGRYLGCAIHRFRKNSDTYPQYEEIYPEDEIPDGSVIYYYLEGNIPPEELDLLQSTIEINQYLTVEKTQELIADIEQLKPYPYRDQPLYAASRLRKLKKPDTDIFDTVSILRNAIRHKRQTKILYGKYDRTLHLAPTSEEARLYNPYAVMSSNGYYYLIAGNPKYGNHVINLRIDRILDVKETKDPREPLPKQLLPYFTDAARTIFQASQYRNDHPVMYSDETVRIHLSCAPSIINNLLDDFGWSIQIRDIPDLKHPDWVHVVTNASLAGAAIFCTHHCTACRVISPEVLREKVVENLKVGMGLYE